MANIIPFSAARPSPELASKVAALPYDVMSSKEAKEEVKDNPYSFLHVDKAEIDLPEGTSLYSEAVYQKAGENLRKMLGEGTLVKDLLPNYYIYQLTMDNRSQTGLVAASLVEDYLKNIIKKHEFTREDKEGDRTRHVEETNAQTGPIFLTYREKKTITNTIEDWKKHYSPVYDFISGDGIGHKVWVVDDLNIQQQLTRLFKEVPFTYIADGHHRTASAATVSQGRKETDPTGKHLHFLSVLFPSNQLHIYDYNRVVKDLAGLTPEEFLEKLEALGVKAAPVDSAYSPPQPTQFGMYLAGQWYALDGAALSIKAETSVGKLDVSLLQDYILGPILKIGDPRVDNRIDFIGGIRGLNELEKRVDSGDWAVAFAMHPTLVEQVLEIADMGLIMPPKSTWFEPKLRSGLFVQLLD